MFLATTVGDRIVVGVGLEVEADNMTACVIVAYPHTDKHVALQQRSQIADFLPVIGLVGPVDAIARHALVEVTHAEGGEESHQFDWRVVDK